MEIVKIAVLHEITKIVKIVKMLKKLRLSKKWLVGFIWLEMVDLRAV